MTWATGIRALTLFQEDLAAATRFYREVFDMAPVFQDDTSAVFRFGETLVNLLAVSAAPELVEPAQVAPAGAGVRAELTLEVADVDGLCRDLQAKGVVLLNGPLDRPWGLRTASFRDPGGHVWELAQGG